MALIEIKNLTWDEVFSLWRDNEAHVPRWIEHYKAAGYANWDEWRKHSMHDLDLQKLDWKLYDIEDPAHTVSEFYGGPFRTWIKHQYDGQRTMQFSELAKKPAVQESLTTNQIIENFPKHSTLMGLRTPQGIFIIEGMHRCCALAVAAYKNIELSPNIQIALADYMDQEIPLSGHEDSPTV